MANNTDTHYLYLALNEAEKSTEPIGCGVVIVKNNTVIAKTHNTQRADNIVINHAEINAIRAANNKEEKRKLSNTVAYCSCEPCLMCLVALSLANVERIVFKYRMKDLFPDDPLAKVDSASILKYLNFQPKLEQID